MSRHVVVGTLNEGESPPDTTSQHTKPKPKRKRTKAKKKK